MKRRDWLLRVGCIGAAVGAGRSAWARSDALLATPFGTHPLLQALQGWNDGVDRAAEGLRVQGRWPQGLRGTLWRNGPGLMARAGQRYRHWFDGDGLVQAWHFDGRPHGAGMRHLARFVQTRKFQQEQAAGEFLLPAFGTAVPARRPLRSADDMNTANTSVLWHGDRLMALWEGGSAIELDPDTLRTLGPRTWDPALQGMPFSAHPKREPDGRVWNFGLFGDRLALYHLGPDGRLLRWRVLSLPTAAMVHDFVVTARHLVFLLPPLRLDRAALRDGASLAGAMRWHGDEPMRVLVIDKDTLEPRRTLEVPPHLVFHVGNGWDDGAGHLRFDCVQSSAEAFVSGRFSAVIDGHDAEPDTPSRLQAMHLDLNAGRVSLQSRSESVEFPQVDPRVVARRHRYLVSPVHLGRQPRWGFNGVQRLDWDTGRVDRFHFGDDVVVEEHLVIPKAGGATEGPAWLLGTGFDAGRQRSFACVFDAEAIDAGPLATVWLPYWVPLGFHGSFRAA